MTNVKDILAKVYHKAVVISEIVTINEIDINVALSVVIYAEIGYSL